MSGTGWGSEGWGYGGWGGPSEREPALVSALAIGENTVQLSFNVPMWFTGLLDVHDASSRKRYALTPVAGTFGQDGTAAKPLGVVSAAVVPMPGTFANQTIVLTTDRPMTPSPAQYVVTCNGLVAGNGTTPLQPQNASARFMSVYKILQPPQLETLSPRGDIAMPQSGESATTGIVPNPSTIALGSFAVNAGDYAVLSGLPEYKERLWRRMISRRDSFLHLAGKRYGAGLLDYGKKIASSHNRSQLTEDVAWQAAQEPETAASSARVVPSAANPGLFYCQLLCRTKFGQPLKLLAPITTSTNT